MPISDERREAWWKAWFDKDYSWEGLADHWASGHVGPDGTHNDGAERPGDRQRLLQDLWCEIEPELIDERDADGNVIRQWTRAHLPMRFASGVAAKLAWGIDDWQALDKELARYIARWRPAGPDRAHDKVDLRGCVLRTLPLEDFPAVALDCRHCAFVDHVRPRLAVIASGICAPLALFEGELDLTDIAVEGPLDFERAVFCSSAWFHGVRTRQRARFPRASFCTEASFRAFEAELLDLGGAETGGSLYLDDAKVSAVVDLSKATIGDGLWAPDLISRTIDLTDCRLTGRLWARGLRCDRIRAERLVASDLVNLAGSLGGEYLTLAGARIGGTLDLTQTDAAEPWFEETDFTGIDCSGAADFNGRIMGRTTSFRSAHFRGPVDFAEVHWPEGPASRGIFRDCIFDKIIDLRGHTSVPFAAFDGISAKADIRINRSDFLEYASFREQIGSQRDEDGLEALENGCRALKLSASATQNRLTEQSFYRFELLARRARPSTALVERVASVLYQRTSDFGLSFTRPLAALALLWLAFAAIYHAGAWGMEPQHWASSLDFSGQQVFKPFSAWSEPSECPEPKSPPIKQVDTSCRLLGEVDARMALATRLLASLQSIVSTSMLFLFGLAIKRRFQIT